MAVATIYLYSLCILSPGRLIKNVGRDVMDRDFVYIYIVLFLIICGTYVFVRRALATGPRLRGNLAQRLRGELGYL